MQQLTQHAQEITRKRTGLPERRARRFLENGLGRAKEAEDYSGRQRAYLKWRGRNGCTALAYNGCCLIRSADGRCVTAYPLPEWFRRRQHYDGKEKIRNVKKYMRLYENGKGDHYGVG